MNTLLFGSLRRPPVGPPGNGLRKRWRLAERCLVFCLTLLLLAILASSDAQAGLTLDSGLVTVETNAVHDGNDEDPKSDSATRNAFPGDAQLSVQSQKIVGQNGMTSIAGATLQSRGANLGVELRGSAGPTAAGFMNNPTGAGTFVGTARGKVVYTFTLTSSHNWNLFWGTTGEVRIANGGGTLNPAGNNATVRIPGVFAESIVGTDAKQGTAGGILGPGTYTIEGIAATIATNAQSSRANMSFALFLIPANRWLNPVDGLFQTAGKWEAGTVPVGQDGALFDVPGTYTVSLISDVSHGSLDMHGSGVNVTFELDGNSYTLGGPFQVGGSPGDAVSLTVRGSGGIVSAGATGDGPTTLAAGDDDQLSMPALNLGAGDAIRYLDRIKHISQFATIDGSWVLESLGTFVEVAQLNVGIRANTAKVELSKNAQLLTGNTALGLESSIGAEPESKGLISLSTGATWQVNGALTVGKVGSGEISLQGDTALTVVGSATLGAEPDAAGKITVKDEGSAFEAQTLVLGQGGIGTLEISDSATAKADTLRITSGFAEITELGRLSIKNNIVIGHGTQPALLLVNGGVLNGDGTAGSIDVGKKGRLSIHDGDASFTSLQVRDEGSASVLNGEANGVDARVDLAGEIELLDDAVFRVKSLRVDGILRIPTTGAVSVGVTGDFTPSSLRINRGGILTGIGFIIANEIVVTGGGSNLFTGEQIRPGNSAGTLTLDGNFRLESGGALIMEIAGTSAGANHDRLVITGNANLGGNLILQFIDGFVPKQGDQFVLLDIAGSITGGFESVEISGLEPGFEFNLLPDANGNLVMTALNDGVPQQSKGKYRGLLLTDPSTHATAGFFNMQVNARHSFAANFVLGGETFRVKGKFDAAGKFTATATGKSGTSATVNLVLSLVNDARAIVGTISVGNQTISLAAEQTRAFNKKNNPAPQAGKYTMLLPFDPQDTDAPKASGYGLVTVTPNGAIRFAGALSDGTRLAQSTVLSRTGEWPFYLLLYKKGGSLAGALQFEDLPGSDFDGPLHWTRPAEPGEDVPGFVTTLAAVGSKYLAPPARPAVLDFPNGATFTLNDPNQTLLLTKSLTLSPPARFTVNDPASDALSLSVKPATGLLSGHFIHPSDSVKTKLRGVVFQKQNFGTGFATVSDGSASFGLRPNP